MRILFRLLILFLPFWHIYGAPELKQDIVEILVPKLNSERIAYFFGNYGVELVQGDISAFEEARITSLYSTAGDQKIMRTLAVTEFRLPMHEDLKQAHHSICQGRSIGIALREHGWKIDKQPVYFGSIALSSRLQAWMQEDSNSSKAAVHVYKLNVAKDDLAESLHYCTIIEVHSPQYLDDAWLQALYGNQYASFLESTEEVDLLMASLNALIREFPER